jgi:hypothetical protein
LLLCLLAGGTTEDHLLLPASLVVRASTAPPAGRHTDEAGDR